MIKNSQKKNRTAKGVILEEPVQKPVIILVNPQLPENIGMVARAMANFSLSELRLVNPREIFPCEKSYAAASKATHVIEQAQVFTSLPESLSDLNYVLATTARARDSFKDVISVDEAVSSLHAHNNQGEKTGILFGRERFGLSNEEISFSDKIVTFPVNSEFSSLNIAQSVLLMAYEWMKLLTMKELLGKKPFDEMEQALPQNEKQAEKGALHGLLTDLETMLDGCGYFRPRERKHVMVDNLRSVLTRAAFTEAEISLLRGMFSSLGRVSSQNCSK